MNKHTTIAHVFANNVHLEGKAAVAAARRHAAGCSRVFCEVVSVQVSHCWTAFLAGEPLVLDKDRLLCESPKQRLDCDRGWMLD